MNATSTQSPQQPLVFDGLLETLFVHVLDAVHVEPLRRALLAAGLDVRRIPPSVEAERFAQWLRLSAQTLAPYGQEVWLAQLGRQLAKGLEKTSLGKVAFAAPPAARDAAQVLRFFQRMIHLGDNVVRLTVEEIAGGRATVVFSTTLGEPAFYRGVLEGAFQHSGFANARVTAQEPVGPGTRFTLWVG